MEEGPQHETVWLTHARTLRIAWSGAASWILFLFMVVRYTRAAHTVRATDITLPENFNTLSDPDIDDWEEVLQFFT